MSFKMSGCRILRGSSSSRVTRGERSIYAENSRPLELGLRKSEVSRLPLTCALLSLGLTTAGSRIRCPECPLPSHPLSKQFLSSSST